VDRVDEMDSLLAEQRAYYRHIAPDYEGCALLEPGGGELSEAMEDFGARGRVLELACGTGIWTQRLVTTASALTAVDASAEMIAMAKQRLGPQADRVRFVQADLFSWRPERAHAYDVVTFGFWLSHVPLSRFDAFWALVAECLAPDGRVFFTDDGHRGPDELAYGEESEVVQRRLRDGSVHRVVKVPHTPRELEARLAGIGWSFEVHPTSGPFFWGVGRRLA
jgi:SAM-dependent methyltransferase